MNEKYELTDITITSWAGLTLRRIKATRDIPEAKVTAGDLGGYVEKDTNLDQSGNAWVYGNARVSGNALVYGNARVSGDAWVSGDVSAKLAVLWSQLAEVQRAELEATAEAMVGVESAA